MEHGTQFPVKTLQYLFMWAGIITNLFTLYARFFTVYISVLGGFNCEVAAAPDKVLTLVRYQTRETVVLDGITVPVDRLLK